MKEEVELQVDPASVSPVPADLAGYAAHLDMVPFAPVRDIARTLRS